MISFYLNLIIRKSVSIQLTFCNFIDLHICICSHILFLQFLNLMPYGSFSTTIWATFEIKSILPLESILFPLIVSPFKMLFPKTKTLSTIQKLFFYDQLPTY